ncbi:alpha/beta fold hydrolase [Chitinophaga pendula]|uniref:thioesterase II family protein n=1 Tax=Chitinophaga TaxID=79328 RepID=UPI000BAF7649|nr:MULTISPECIES: alpha/beta fold hydrolase [Chitinophaga]ASZ12180.1 hypothetical protein CK934_15040 [Chitinophaga sp. MD30]UCJ04790.1 alpha/beta fold hydrolase [Chitinophaga pendula]
MKRINMLCLPFSGGNKYSYRPFQDVLPPVLQLVPVEYPGRGTRIKEPLLRDLTALSLDVFEQVKAVTAEGDYVIYGHSMGATVGFELMHHITNAGLRPPLHFFATGRSGPATQKRVAGRWHELSPAGFVAKLKELDGCPEAFFADAELMAFLEPIIRADFEAVETYRYERRAPLRVGMTVVMGTEEQIPEESVQLWQQECAFKVDFRMMKGRHFFIFDTPRELLQLIVEKTNISYKLNYL